MNTRRKFLFQGGLAATALIATNPIDALANFTSPVNGGGINHFNSITFLHTTGAGPVVASRVKQIAAKNTSIVLQHAVTATTETTQPIHFDASATTLQDDFSADYKIVYKDNIRVGIIAVNAREEDAVNRVNELSARLKKEMDCHLVVCISGLGYKNKNRMDDITLAGESEHVDIIVAHHTVNSPQHPVIQRNKKKAEVIIQHTDNCTDALSKIKIGFNQQGSKYHVSF